MAKLHFVTRLEIIDDAGRAYVGSNIVIKNVSYQDNDQTLKIFVGRRENYTSLEELARLMGLTYPGKAKKREKK